MTQLIQDKLASIEQQHNVKIVYACEAGSRAWGWDRVDGSSDYDLRFIYVEELPFYFTVAQSQRRAIDGEDGLLDYAGLELGHALRLLANSNPNLLEQVYSPIVYCDNALEPLQILASAYFKPIAAYHHYLSMAKSNWMDWQKAALDKAADLSLRKPLKKLMVVVRAHLLLRAVAEFNFHYVDYIGKNGIYNLAKMFMDETQQTAFHYCLLALREITERHDESELIMQQWIRSSLCNGNLPNAPTAPLEKQSLEMIDNFFMNTVLTNHV